jgi:hypothetical protein
MKVSRALWAEEASVQQHRGGRVWTFREVFLAVPEVWVKQKRVFQGCLPY